MKTFLESLKFPVQEVNKKSSGEKGPGRPPYWEMVFYWTRKPLVGARSVIAGALLPENVDENLFKAAVRLSSPTPHRENPQIPAEFAKYFEGKKLLDPFAGFGSIPLEGLRLGLDVTAVELLPTTYIFLKAVLEYPKKFGKSLIKDVGRWGEWITEQLKNDPEIRELYDDDVAVYIGTWEIKCPHCGRWTPAIGNFWLARVKDNKGYKRLAYMKPEKNGDEVEIKVIDLNEILGDISKAKIDGNEIIFEGENYVKTVKEAIRSGKLKQNDVKIDGNKVIFKVPSANIESRRSQLTCLMCGNVIKYADENGNHHMKLKNGDFYVKFALRKYHEGDEHFARQRLLVKVKIDERDLIFEPATREDNERLWKAKEKVKEMLEKGDPDVPSETIPLYENRRITPILSAEKWYQFFNPRQLLTLIKIVRLIREVGKKVEEEKLKEGWSAEQAFEYAEAVATYLSVALVNQVRHNCVLTSVEPTRKFVAHALASRGIAMTWNWIEEIPWRYFIGTWERSFKVLKNGISYLTSAISASQSTLLNFTGSSIKVLQGDATSLNLGEKFDVIVTDPPYADDVPYTELSDFYYVWLKRALSDVENGKLVPRFHKEAFFKRIGPKWVEIKTQWQEFAKKEVSTNPGRFMDDENKKEKAVQHFENLFSQAFVAMREHLKDDGVLVTYYAHTNPESWINLIEAGWRRAKLQITRAIPLTTESETSIVSRGKMSLDTSIVAVWRKQREEKTVQISTLKEEIERKAKSSAREFIEYGYEGLDLLYGVMAAVLEEVTKYREISSLKGPLTTEEILNEYVYPATIRGIVNAIAEIEGSGTLHSGVAMFYTAYKILFGNASLSANDIVLLRLATSTDPRELINSGVLKEKKSSSSKEYTLYTPDLLGKKALDTKEFQKFLHEKKLDPAEPKPRNSVDVLQLLEYYSLLGRSKVKEEIEKLRKMWAGEVEEALFIARLVSEYYAEIYIRKIDPVRRMKEEFASEIDRELEKDGFLEVVLMRRLLGYVGGAV
jgi:putative DNA methylase